MIELEGPFILDPRHVEGYGDIRWPTATLANGLVVVSVHSANVTFIVDPNLRTATLLQPDAGQEAWRQATYSRLGIEDWKRMRPGLSRMDGLAIYCRSNRCASEALRFGRAPTLVARWMPIANDLDVVIFHVKRASRRRHNSRTGWAASLLPADIKCLRCGTQGSARAIALTGPPTQA